LVRRRNGKYYWISEDGEFAPYIGGGAPDDEDPTEDDDDDDPDDEDDDDDDKTFSQADVDRIVQKKERKLRRSITRTLEDELGVSLEEAKSIVKQVQDGTKPDAMAEVNRLRQQLEDREQEIANREVSLLVREKLQDAGVKPARLKRAVRLVELDEDPDDDDIIAAIAELQDDMPELFVTEEEPDPDEGKSRRKLPSGGTRTPRRKPARREDAFAEGAKLAQQVQSTF
jgi:DNA-binding transcriptional MerR regulator